MDSQKYEWNNWNEIDWKTVEIAVFKLQKRIYKASQRGDIKAVHKFCGLYFKEGDLLELDHIVPKSKGGKNEYKNFQLLHKHCHDSKTATDGSLENIPVDKIPSQQLQSIAEHLFNDKIKEGDRKISAWEFQVLRKAGLLTCIHDKESIREKPYEVKVSRTVLKTSGSGDTSA